MKIKLNKPISSSTESQEKILLAAFGKEPNRGWNKYEACRELGIDHLAARIKGLRYKGYIFDSFESVIVDFFGIARRGVKTYFFKGRQKLINDDLLTHTEGSSHDSK